MMPPLTTVISSTSAPTNVSSDSSSSALPRLVVYQQTHHDRNGDPISLLPLWDSNTGVTHVYIAAIHLNDRPGDITLNNHAPGDKRHEHMWGEVKLLQERGVKVMGMLGGAAKGSFDNLGQDFEAYYLPLAEMIRRYALQGLDLDIEEPTPLPLVTKLISRLKTDFGPPFIVTLAPVAPGLIASKPYLASLTRRLLHKDLAGASDLVKALVKPELLHGRRNLSGFNHFHLEHSEEGRLIDWYNVQFYCGWGDASTTAGFDSMVESGWDPKRLVLGVLTSPQCGHGFVGTPALKHTIEQLKRRYGDEGFGGVMGWEYALAGSEGRPWEWVREIGLALGRVGRDERNLSCMSCDPVDIDPKDSGQPVVLPSEAPLDESAAVEGAGGIPVEGEGRSLPDRPAGISVPNDRDIQKLVEMGFERPEAIAALEAMGGNVDAAAGLLFGD